uniref:Uncharacterized protein n=1 Tax=Tolypothrix bouteillei VB521301 TaxID=1479485 RepID=A0A0C1MWF3_9CYAN
MLGREFVDVLLGGAATLEVEHLAEELLDGRWILGGFQAYLKKAGEVLTKDNYFISSFTLASSHLTKQETSNIYLSIIIAYSAFKNQGY